MLEKIARTGQKPSPSHVVTARPDDQIASPEQVDDNIKLICHNVKGSANGNEDPHFLENSRRQETGQGRVRDGEACQGAEMRKKMMKLGI